ncbi:hypothetical protein ACFWZY_01705 [Streptomyces sp. NPDC058992]|uniref:hypothetical protein n=1 Tax=Streptomyces sp. NPDC058992 TaxID=3346688 RepID=UPI00368BF14A
MSPRGSATTAQKKWNRGKAGAPKPGQPRPTGRACVTAGCGELAELPRPAAGMVRVAFPGSREPARWYCPQACAAYGHALAEVRALPTS